MNISLEEAILRIKNRLDPLPPKSVPLIEALGLISAGELISEIDQPPFPRSPYDGYALRSCDSAGASASSPSELRIIGRSYAGKPSGVSVGHGEAVRIMTGGEIPDGSDCVVAQEKTDWGEALVKIFTELRPLENYCGRGEDFALGSRLVSGGTPVTAAVIGVASGAGYTEISVFPKPSVALISTGDELVPPGSALGRGQIYDSNTALLEARLSELKIPFAARSYVADDLPKLKRAFEAASGNSDMIISTGGVSAGEKDLVPAALKSLGAEMVFHGVSIRPGMPSAFALLHGRPVLSLSGNPSASAVSFELLARTAFAVLASNPLLEARRSEAVLTKPLRQRRSGRLFRHALMRDGKLLLPGEQGKGQLKTMIGCNCIAELPMGDAVLPAGSTVNVYMLEAN